MGGMLVGVSWSLLELELELALLGRGEGVGGRVDGGYEGG